MQSSRAGGAFPSATIDQEEAVAVMLEKYRMTAATLPLRSGE